MEPVTERGWATRQRLLEAAEHVFGAQDYFRAAISDVVREAGVGQGTFYLYFGSKLDIFRELVRWLGHELRREMKLATEGVEGRLATEMAGFRAFFAFVGRHQQAYRIVKQAETVDPAVYREYYETLADGYRDAIAAAITRHDYRPYRNPEAIAYMLMGIGDFLGMRYLLWEPGPLPEAVQQDLAAFLHHALAPGSVDRGADGVADGWSGDGRGLGRADDPHPPPGPLPLHEYGEGGGEGPQRGGGAER